MGNENSLEQYTQEIYNPEEGFYTIVALADFIQANTKPGLYCSVERNNEGFPYEVLFFESKEIYEQSNGLEGILGGHSGLNYFVNFKKHKINLHSLDEFLVEDYMEKPFIVPKLNLEFKFFEHDGIRPDQFEQIIGTDHI